MEGIKAKGIPGGIETTGRVVNGVRCEIFRNTVKKSDKVILYLHGGGFCLGIYHANREFVARLALMTGMDAYMPDYRLAPEYPFPAALEDAIAVYKAILSEGYRDIVMMGDSSGCALAVSALLVLKQSGQRMPGSMVFMTPVFDLAGKGESFTSKAGKDPFQSIDPLSIAKIYISDNNPASPMLSPLYSELKGLPPTLIHAAEYDVFLSDATRFAEQAKNDGATVDIKVWKKMWHIFHMQAPFVPESSKALEEIRLFLETDSPRQVTAKHDYRT
jgi:acetyl esterase/lipase